MMFYDAIMSGKIRGWVEEGGGRGEGGREEREKCRRGEIQKTEFKVVLMCGERARV